MNENLTNDRSLAPTDYNLQQTQPYNQEASYSDPGPQRTFKCDWDGCTKAYYYLSHLNRHIEASKHGSRRVTRGMCFEVRCCSTLTFVDFRPEASTRNPLLWHNNILQTASPTHEGSNEDRNIVAEEYGLQHGVIFAPFTPVSYTGASSEYNSVAIDEASIPTTAVSPTVEQVLHEARTEMTAAIGRAFEAQLVAENERREKDSAIKRAQQAEQETALFKERAEKAEQAIAATMEKQIQSLEQGAIRLERLIPQSGQMTENWEEADQKADHNQGRKAACICGRLDGGMHQTMIVDEDAETITNAFNSLSDQYPPPSNMISARDSSDPHIASGVHHTVDDVQTQPTLALATQQVQPHIKLVFDTSGSSRRRGRDYTKEYLQKLKNAARCKHRDSAAVLC